MFMKVPLVPVKLLGRDVKYNKSNFMFIKYIVELHILCSVVCLKVTSLIVNTYICELNVHK